MLMIFRCSAEMASMLIPLLLRSRCYCAPAATALPLLLRSRCYCAPAAIALPLLLRTRCYYASAATALPLLLRSRCYCAPAPAATAFLLLLLLRSIKRLTYVEFLNIATDIYQTNASRFRCTEFVDIIMVTKILVKYTKNVLDKQENEH